MKRKILLPIVAGALIASASTALISCGSSKTNNPDELRIVLYNAGWGDEWLNDTIDSWEEKNPGKTVNLTSLYEVNTLIGRRLVSSDNSDDLYITTYNGWRNYAAQGLFAPLDDLLKETVDGVTVEEKVDDAFDDHLYFKNSDGSEHCYRLPWTSGMGGIYYNAKMFEENGWEIPKTTEELTALVNQIKEDRIPVDGDDTATVVPFAYSGQNTDYFDYAVLTWWMQLAGEDAVKEFFNYSSADNFNSNNASGIYDELKTAVTYWYSLFSDPSNYLSGSIDYSNHDAQRAVFNGRAAMVFTGDWVYNEVLKYGTNSNFELGFMGTPTITGAKESGITYAIGSDQYIAIPESSTEKDLAKSFIKEMISNAQLSNFTNKAHGFLAYDNGDTSTIDTSNSYIKSYLDVRNETTTRISDESDAMIYLNQDIQNIWVTSASRPFLGLLQGSVTIDDAFDTIYKQAQSAFAEY